MAQAHFTDFICKAYDMTRDQTKYIVVSVNVQNNKTKHIHVWTHCEWFKFEMPSKLIYGWISDVEPDLKDIELSLTCKLNDNTIIPINSNDTRNIKDICASHIMEIECTNRQSK